MTTVFDSVLVSDVSLYLLTGIAAVVAYIVFRRFADDENWEKYGVKQGTMGLTDFGSACTKLLEEQGDTVGVKYSGLVLITRDLEILKNVMVRDFNNFMKRKIRSSSNSVIVKGLFFMHGDNWRRSRHILSPCFSSGKLKHVSKTIDETAIKLAKVLEDRGRARKLVEIKYVTGQYTSEIIAKTAFGLHTDCLGGEDDEFTFYCKRLVKVPNKFMSKVMVIFLLFPRLQRFLVQKLKISLLDSFSSDADVYFRSVLRKSIAEREKYEMSGGRKPADLLQSMVSAKAAGDREAAARADDDRDNNDDDDDVDDADGSFEKIPKTMTQDELIGHSLLIIFAGFETTATALQMCLYLLAKHPHVQEKLYEEIERVLSSDSPTNEELGQLKYMEQVINETLRLYPPAPTINRRAAQSRTYGTITIPKNATVLIPIFLVHKDPKNFPDPETFDPERFSDENKAKRDPMAFMPFGNGLRLCLGMRLAYLELKIALVHVLRKVTFELNDQTSPKRGEDVKQKRQGLLEIEEPIQLCVKPRHL